MTKRIALIGSGLIGCGWAVVFARAGWRVSLYDIKPNRVNIAKEEISKTLDNLEKYSFVTSAKDCLSLIEPFDLIEEAIHEADFVQENILENPEDKRKIFSYLDRALPHNIILGSSSSTIPASDFTKNLDGKKRCIVVHPCNPPYLVPLVEIVPSPWTSQDTIDFSMNLMSKVELIPILLSKEIYGFVLNRLQVALVNEAMHLIKENIVTPEDLEKTLKNGLGLRWSFMGPFQTMDLAASSGFKEYATKFGHSYRNMGKELGVANEWSENAIEKIEDFLRNEVPIDKLKDRSDWRDRKLLKLMQNDFKN